MNRLNGAAQEGDERQANQEDNAGAGGQQEEAQDGGLGHS